MYLGNQGVLVSRGETRVLFDPLFEEDFNQFQLLPDDMQRKLFAGEPPFDDIDSVFISHAHSDHFSPTLMRDFLRARQEVWLYAPAQAISMLREATDDEGVLTRATSLAIDNGDPPFTLAIGGLEVSVVRIPHSGWPDRWAELANLAYRITLDDAISVAHFGDADANPGHFTRYADYWREVRIDMAFPPYWFFLSPDGRQIFSDIIEPTRAVGTHVPKVLPDHPAVSTPEFRAFDLFTEPGETRDIP